MTAAEGLVVVVDDPGGDGAGCLRLVGDVSDGEKWILQDGSERAQYPLT